MVDEETESGRLVQEVFWRSILQHPGLDESRDAIELGDDLGETGEEGVTILSINVLQTNDESFCLRHT
jgi:hypothetical protein